MRMTVEDDKYKIPEKLLKMSPDELECEKEKALKKAMTKRRIRKLILQYLPDTRMTRMLISRF